MAENLGTWFAVIFIGYYVVAGLAVVWIHFLEWMRKHPEPTARDVRHAAEQYRLYFGDEALTVIGEHTMAATFAPYSFHKKFLVRVTKELMVEQRSSVPKL